MKSTILTHPILGNYGGSIQAYALQRVLLTLTERANIIDYFPSAPTTCRQLLSFLKHKIYQKLALIALRFPIGVIPNSYYSECHGARFAARFTKKSINWNQVSNQCSVVVGSDQVWRAPYARYLHSLPFFFLSFASRDIRENSITYAASFGTDEWEGTPEETVECGRLLREFKAVSVREHSGVKICKEVFGVDAVQMPDPTLLLHPEDYGQIIDSEKTWLPVGKYVAAYVLDETEGKANLLQECTKSVDMQLQHLMPHADAKKRRDCFPISVPQWLRLIRDCEYFITDSFHGCVFAIIYNKPFVCLGNEGRGNARFDTLLGTFGLEDRLITNATSEKLLQVLNAPIDWERVNAIHDAERERGINFLKENLL